MPRLLEQTLAKPSIRGVHRDQVRATPGGRHTTVPRPPRALKRGRLGFSDCRHLFGRPIPKRRTWLVGLARATGKGQGRFALAHTDVVGSHTREDWKHGWPFQFIERTGYFSGRGTGDDKAQAACLGSPNLIPATSAEGFQAGDRDYHRGAYRRLEEGGGP